MKRFVREVSVSRCSSSAPFRARDERLKSPEINESQSTVVVETQEFATAKLNEIERALDQLPDHLKEAYFIAIDEEIKQKTHHIRSHKFLLAFLRTDNFDASKAALRLGNFLKWKLELFGRKMLPRRVRQCDLSEDDKEVLASGYCFVGDQDCCGRIVLLFIRERLREHGLLHERYSQNVARACFYQMMCAIENNEQCQNKGYVVIRWGLNSSLPLKDYQVVFRSLIHGYKCALPIKINTVHNVCDNSVERLCVSWATEFNRKFSQQKSFLHGPSAADSLSSLTRQGVNVDSLPLTPTGDFRPEVSQTRLKQMRERELSSMLNEIEVNQVHERQFQCRSDVCLSIDAASGANEDSGKKIHESVQVEKHDTKTKAKSSNAASLKLAEEFEIFSLKLMDILERGKTPDAIWWSHGGNALAIEKKKFSECVLPNEFDGIKYNSFLRRLRRWGFQRLSNKESSSSGCVEYQHRLFKRKFPQLLKNWDSTHEDGHLRKDKLPVKLMNILDSNSAKDAIWWICDGKAFAIETTKFSCDVLEKEFDGLKLSSFLRMLRKWGFKRLYDQTKQNNSDILLYQHALFQKDSLLFKKNSEDPLRDWKSLDATNKLTTIDSVRMTDDKFPVKLYKALDRRTSLKALWWLDCGTAFAIDSIKFPRDALQKEFHGIKFNSFLRSIARWGFKKINVLGLRHEKNICVYQHPLFKRDSPELLDKWNEKNTEEIHRKDGVKKDAASVEHVSSSTQESEVPTNAASLPKLGTVETTSNALKNMDHLQKYKCNETLIQRCSNVNAISANQQSVKQNDNPNLTQPQAREIMHASNQLAIQTVRNVLQHNQCLTLQQHGILPPTSMHFPVQYSSGTQLHGMPLNLPYTPLYMQGMNQIHHRASLPINLMSRVPNGQIPFFGQNIDQILRRRRLQEYLELNYN